MTSHARLKVWLALAGYVLLATANAAVLVVEFLREDSRWWRFLLSTLFLLMGLAGIANQREKLRTDGPAADPHAVHGHPDLGHTDLGSSAIERTPVERAPAAGPEAQGRDEPTV
jgi:hypothetical protein